ncbi:hypothetical protein AMD01_17795 [Priestia koreensis]|uniref:DUF111 family protein n=1 Tax=Priestia koreensis TaxID=284581 RepID=A0A0M0KVZ2_9BACI|nr:hypothetical protein AMD01_17795 [Priestia koreensis]
MSFSHKEEHVDYDMLKLEVNLDDISGEWLGYVMDQLFEAGANDVFYTPIYMKKNRPGVMLQVLCSTQFLEEIERIVFQETTTLGVRYYGVNVHRLERSFYSVNTPWGEVAVKKGTYKGKVVQHAPEYEDCNNIARTHRVPLKHVYQEVWKQIQN